MTVALVKPREKDTQRAILEYLTLRGHFHFRNNTGATSGEYKGKKWFMRFGAVGSGDIIGLKKPTGTFFTIEVKAKGNKPTPAQVEFMDKVSQSGGIAILAYSVDDVMRYL